MTKKKIVITPKKKRCIGCKKRRVINHHWFCSRCWKIKHLR